MLVLGCGVAAAFNIERGHYGGPGEIAFSNSYLPLADDGCPSSAPTPAPSPQGTPALQPRDDRIVTVLNSSVLSGYPGDTLPLRGSLTNTTSETYVAGGWGIVTDPSICLGNVPQCPLDSIGSPFIINTIPALTSTDEIDIAVIRLNPLYTGPFPRIMNFTFYTFKPGIFTGIVNFSVRILPRPNPSLPPVLYIEPCTQRAVALNSVNLALEPFVLTNPINFSSDQRTRVTLFAWNMNLQSGEGPAAVTVQAIDSQQAIHPLPVEFVSDVVGHPGLTQIIVRLADNLPQGTDLRLRVLVHGFTSNEAPMAIKSG